ncbi:hypothetical protein M758_7G012300 [Ceratodon purpureus]|nr:hypothetical protein M758_7G012300 [Ceratodon purpureus]
MTENFSSPGFQVKVEYQLCTKMIDKRTFFSHFTKYHSLTSTRSKSGKLSSTSLTLYELLQQTHTYYPSPSLCLRRLNVPTWS